jgi:hypothetical protein
MNRSFSKIRHIQEANLNLEKRLLKEDLTDNNDKFSEIIRMDQDLDDDPIYKKYEKIYLRKKILDQVGEQMGIDPSEMSDEEIDGLVDMFSMIMDISKDESGNKLTPENIMKHKDGVLQTVQIIKDMATEDGEDELSSKIDVFINKLNEI